MQPQQPITVVALVNTSLQHAWRTFTDPSTVMQWNFASADWCCPRAKSDLRPGGAFCYRMEARDGSMAFDFEGHFTEVTPNDRLAIELSDGRIVTVSFKRAGELIEVRQIFAPDANAPVEMQRAGWQAIMDNYKAFAEASSPSDA